MRGIAACVAIAILLAITFGARTAARELMAPIDGIERIARSSPALNVETEVEIIVDPITGEVDGSTAVSLASLQAVKRELDEAVASQTPRIHVQREMFGLIKLGESQQAMLAEWGRWKSRAIAELPESIREDSEYRKAIDETYDSAYRAIFCTVQISDVLAEGEVSLQLVGFTDIDEQSTIEFVTPESAHLETYDLRAPSAHPTLMRLSWGSFPIGEPGVEVTRE